MDKYLDKDKKLESVIKDFLSDKFNIVEVTLDLNSKVDIFGIDTKNSRVLLINCKKGMDFKINFIKDMEVIFIEIGKLEDLKDFLNS
ncbi:MAG TPA: hypothetical protein PL042_08495 [Caldisericia bacterium]|nr:hypothetical protein [Caldisericia bacterium]